MTVRAFSLSYNERLRLHRRAHRRQKLDQGEVCGLLVTNRVHQLTLIFLTNLAKGRRVVKDVPLLLQNARTTRRPSRFRMNAN